MNPFSGEMTFMEKFSKKSFLASAYIFFIATAGKDCAGQTYGLIPAAQKKYVQRV